MNKIMQAGVLILAAIWLAAACGPAATQPAATPAAIVPTVAKAGAVVPASTAAPAAVNGGTFTRAMTSEPATIDPQGAPNSGLSLVLPYLFDTLVVRDNANKLLPALAESWQVAPDGKALTFKLKPGVVFQDGTPLNAEAVRATFQRFKDTGQKSPIYAGVQQIAGIEAVDALTVRFTFAKPAANIWSTLSMPYAGIVSPDSIRKAAADGGKSPLVGTGPFVLDAWRAGQSITLKRNPAYRWGSVLSQNPGAPYLDAVVFKVIPDATTQLAALEAGDVDAIFINQPDHRQKLQGNPQIRLEETVLNSVIFLAFNYRKAPFNDVRVRRALAAAVSKDDVVKLALGGIGMRATMYLPPSLPGYDASLKNYEVGYDPKQSAAGLKDAGFAQGADGTWSKDGQPLKVVLLTSNRAPNDTISALVQSELKAIGVPAEIQQLDSKAVMDAASAGKFDLLLWRYDWNDPDALNVFLGTETIGSTNRAGYSNPAVDKLLAQGAQELDDTARLKLYVEAQKLIMQDVPWQPLYVPIDVLAVNRRVDGVQIGFMGRMLLNDAFIVKK